MLRRALPLLIAALAVIVIAAPARAQTKLVNSPSIFEPIFASDPAGAIEAARQKIAAGDLQSAIAGLETYVVSHPNEIAPMRFLGDLYYRAGKFSKAEYIYQTMIGKNAHDKESHNRLGVVYATENRIDDAIGEFNAALPGTDSVGDLVTMHARKGDLPAYQAQMEHVAEQYPSDADIQAELGQVYATMHESDRAMPYFRRALDDDPNSLTAINGLGLAYLDQRDYTSAAEYFKRCLSLDPTNYSCNDNLAADLLEARRFTEAQPVLDRAYHLAPERPEALINYGYLSDMYGDWKKAVTFYVRAISVGPYTPEAYVNLGIDYETNALYPLAQSALLKGAAAVPQDGRIRFLLGRAYAEQGQTQLAIKEFSAAEHSFDPSIAHIAQQESAKLAPSASPTAQ
jgi:tetratricopeptide (TPR) repeat protein